jgi:putative tricarboxylic transport membrane protein
MVTRWVESLFIMALACVGLTDAWRLSHAVRAGGAFHDVIGPDRYLGIISAGLLVCGVLNLVGSLKRPGRPEIRRVEEGGSRVTLVIVVSFVLAIYTLLIQILGYLLATSLFFPVIYYLFGLRPWLKSVVIGLSTAIFFYAIFEYFAEIPLPKGLLEKIL